ncbi:LysR family transcriptional regulator [Rahnella variigena]|jgi:DNA-binding transcriptional LysR family regulator|uniref:LysR family transcriptional regulator n=1 Tax=Rahnella variigena TaxID=574964 RepID=UPI000DE85602|nr:MULTISPECIES: LysR family transcriptional regulator [Rahnella]RBQ33688.1 hypothetical protein C2125_13570 [Rahnella aquatilis]
MKKNPNRRLKEWRVFFKIVELQSISLAAKALCIEVSTASKALSILEEALGIKLIDRSTRSLEITHAGLVAYERMKELTQEIDSFLNEFMERRNNLDEELTISAPAILCDGLLIDWITSFQNTHKKTSFYLHSIKCYDNFKNKNYNLSIRLNNVEDKHLICEKLSNIELIMCASKEYIEKHGIISHPKELYSHETFMLWDNEGKGILRLKNGDEEFIYTPKRRQFQTSDILSQFNLMLKGSGIAVLTPEWLAIGHLNSGNIVQLLPQWKASDMPVYITWKHSKFYPNLLIEFVRFIQNACNNS